MNIPNILTSLRVLLIPVIVLVYYLPVEWSSFAAAVLFAIACVTDWLDGHLARRWDQHTSFGAFLDPVADKLVVAAALAVLIETYADAWLTLPALVIIGREIVISALREWMAEIGKRANVSVSKMGKWKTTAQMVAIVGLLGNTPGTILAEISLVLLYLAAGLTLWSMYIYLDAAWHDLTKEMS